MFSKNSSKAMVLTIFSGIACISTHHNAKAAMFGLVFIFLALITCAMAAVDN